MKALFYLQFAIFATVSVFNTALAQTPSWAWAKQSVSFGGSFDLKGMGSDANGNTYSLGYTYAGISFGNLPPLPGGMFLVKHSPQGNPVWAVQGKCLPAALATDSAGNSYVTGFFSDTLSLGGNMLICEGKKDIFVAKFDSSGNVVWARKGGGIGNHPLMPPMPPVMEDEAYSIAIDKLGNCYIGGWVVATDTSAALFDTIAVSPPISTLFPYRFNVLVKYNNDGYAQWVKSINTSFMISKSIAVDILGKIFLTGDFRNTIDINGTILTSYGEDDVCFASYDSTGNLLWARSFGGTGDDTGSAIAVNDQNEIFLSGSFEDVVVLDSTFIFADPNGGAKVYLIKCNINGQVIWASQTTGTGISGDSQIAYDQSGNSYVSFTYADSIFVGQQLFVTSYPGNFDVLVSKWDNSGLPVWAVSAQGNGNNDYPKGIVLNPDYTACYVAGSFEQNLEFGNTILQTGQNASFFLAKLENIVSSAPEMLNQAGWSIYPNPAGRSFSVALENTPTGNKGKFFLYNITGQLMRQVNFAGSSKIEIIRDNLPSGLYIYKLQTENSVLGMGKIILN